MYFIVYMLIINSKPVYKGDTGIITVMSKIIKSYEKGSNLLMSKEK